MESNNETHNNGTTSKRQQFTNKQRMDMYAFCVLELEMHSNKVSIKKQQQAIQRVLSQENKTLAATNSTVCSNNTNGSHNEHQQLQLTQPASINHNSSTSPSNSSSPRITIHTNNTNALCGVQQQPPPTVSTQPHDQQLELTQQRSETTSQQSQIVPVTDQQHNNDSPVTTNDLDQSGSSGSCSNGEKTLLQLQLEVAMTRRCYSDYQKTQVLTSSMLRDVQKRFAKYYPDSAIPSRTTIKHVFEKCVAHGTVENIKTPRKATKIPQGDEIEYLLIHEPQLSLRQMAQKLNVSTGTVSRRCKALGLIPESVTIKHQQMATARRQKQMKQLGINSKTTDKVSAPGARLAITNAQDDSEV